MISVKVHRKRGNGERPRLIAEAVASRLHPTTLPTAEATESDFFTIQFGIPDALPPAIRVFVGTVLVASTIPTDRAIAIDYPDESVESSPPLECRGRLLADWVGLTELVVRVRSGDEPDWHRVLTLPLAVSAGKLAAVQFDQLFAELERDSAAVLLDVHGKTQLGLKGGRPLVPSAPVAVLCRLRETVRELDQLLHRIARQPASRLRTTPIRERALAGQAVSDETLARACREPDLLGRVGTRLVFREHFRELARPDYRIPEHRAFADFAEYLKAQLADLRRRIDVEIEDRKWRTLWRNRAKEPGLPTWWESEDLPRIEELERCRTELGILRATVESWTVFPFLPPGRHLNRRPESTPLFRNHPAYRRAFRVLVGHFTLYRATLDIGPLMSRARSLPVLYEWWCAVRVIRALARGLQPLVDDPERPSVVTSKLTHEGKRFTVEFAQDQAMNFVDGRGLRVRFRYVPEYRNAGGRGGAAFGVLDALLRTPDMALEIYAPGAVVPRLIVVLDAKYSSRPQTEKQDEVATKYAKIGDARTGRVLSRQVWALTPLAPATVTDHAGLRRHCTVDNEAFWSPEFDSGNPVCGAVRAIPVAGNSFDPLQSLIETLLRMEGVDYRDRSTEADTAKF